MIKIRSLQIILIVMILLTASLACNLPGRSISLLPDTAPINEVEIEQLEGNLKATLESSIHSGQVTLTITEQQINAYMISQLNKQDEFSFFDPVVVLTNNQIEVYGKINQSGLSINSKMVLKPYIDGNGDPKLDLDSIDLGALPVPDSMKNRVETMVDDTLADYLAAGSNRFNVTNISISDGQMTITGTLQEP